MWLAIFLFFTWVVEAEEIPLAKLVRKSDGVVVGIGASRFEGVANPQDYEVVAITRVEADALLVQVEADQKAAEKARQKKRADDRKSGDAKLKSLGLTDDELEAR